MQRVLGVIAATVLTVAVLPLAAGASTITDGGLEAGFGCTNGFQCGNGSETFIYDGTSASGPGYDFATGLLDLDVGNLTLDLDYVVASATYVDIAGPDNGIDEIIFTNLHYSATGLGLIHLGSGVYSVTGSVLVEGSYEQLLLGSTVVAAQAFSLSVKVVSGQCTEVGGPVVCHTDLGPGGPFKLDVGLAPSARRFQHTFNLISAPEPSTALLICAGLAGLALNRRRRA